MLVADSSAILASINANDAAHAAVRSVLDQDRGRLIVTDFIIAEVDYLALKHLGREAEEAFLEDVLAGGWSREPVLPADLGRALEIIRKYREHDIGIADASLLAIAERLNVRRILTLDRRHFSTLRFRDGKPPTVLPRAS